MLDINGSGVKDLYSGSGFGGEGHGMLLKLELSARCYPGSKD